MLPHLEALEAIALRDPFAQGNRATGTIGFENSASTSAAPCGSVDYFVETLEFEAGAAPRAGTPSPNSAGPVTA